MNQVNHSSNSTKQIFNGFERYTKSSAWPAYAGVIIMFCGFVLIAFVKPWGQVVPAKVPLIGGRKIHPLILVIPAFVGAVFLIVHGITGIITTTLLLAGIITMDFPAFAEVDIHKLALWDLLFFEPWFVFLGIMSGLTVSHYTQASGIRPSIRRRGTVLFGTYHKMNLQ